MKRMLIAFLLVSFQCYGADIVYLTCDGVVRDSELNVDIKKVQNDFLLNREEKTVQQIITGLTEEQTKDLKQTYTETTTQYVTSDGSLSINRRTLEYAFRGVMGMRINGLCKVVQPTI